MPSDWKESANKRRDFRHTKGDPEVAKLKSKNRKKKTHKVTCDSSFGFGKWTLGKYTSKKIAEEALKSYQNKGWLSGSNLKIEEI